MIMLFLQQEKEKMGDWWRATGRKQILTYFLSALALVLIVTLYYYILGITGLTHWHRFGRNMGECFLLIFLTELMTGKSLLHPFWRIGYIPFFSWIFVFPYVLIHAVNGIHDPAFNHLSAYALTSFGSLLFIFFMMNVICRVYVGKRIATTLCLLVVSFFTFSAFIFVTHYAFMGIMMSTKEIFFAMYEPMLWFQRIVLNHIGAIPLVLMTGGMMGFLIVYWHWIYQSAYLLSPKWKNSRTSYSLIHRILQFLVFFGCVWLLLRWIGECFPLYQYEMASQYKEYIDFIQNTDL